MKQDCLLMNPVVTYAICELQKGQKPTIHFESAIDWIMEAVEYLQGAQKQVDLEHVFNIIQWLRHYRRVTENIATGEE